MIKAEYIDHMGSDARVTDAARVSFNKRSEQFSSERNEKLIRYLARNGHFTPFCHPQITMRETVPIFVSRQRFRHIVGFSYSEASRRYVDDEPQFYSPDTWRERPEKGIKQGSGGVHKYSQWCDRGYRDLIEAAKDLYKSMIDEGVAPEQARMVLPQSMVTSYFVTGSLAAWARAYNLRSDPRAQHEIQLLADQWDSIIQPLFPVSWRALTGEEFDG